MNAKRIIAGILAILMMATQVPEARITAMAAEELPLTDDTNEDGHTDPDDDGHVHGADDDCSDENCDIHNHKEEQGGDDQQTPPVQEEQTIPAEEEKLEPTEEQKQEQVETKKPFSAKGVVYFTEKKVEFEEAAPEYDLDKLAGKDKRLYDAIKPELDKILEGQKPSDSVIEIPTCLILNDKLSYTYTELEIETTEEAEDPVVDSAALDVAVKKTLTNDLQKVSEALLSEKKGTVKWIPTEAGVKFTRDAEKVYIEDSLLWTVVFDVKAADDKPELTDDQAKELEDALKNDLKTDEELKNEKADKTAEDKDKTDKTVEDKDETDPEKDTDKAADDADDADKTELDPTLGGGANTADLLNDSKLATTGLGTDLFGDLTNAEEEYSFDAGEQALYDERTQGFWVSGISEEAYPYQLTPVVIEDLKVFWGKKLLTSGTDYTVTYRNNNRPGKATVTVTGKGNYTGSVTKTFTIEQDEQYTSSKEAVALTGKNVTFEGFVASFPYNGELQDQNYNTTLYFNKDTVLAEGWDYVVTYSAEPVKVGTYTVTFTGIGDYKGSLKKTYKITPVHINNASFAVEGNVYYRKGGAKPVIVGDFGGQELKEGTDYTVAYRNNAKVGAVATVTITGRGNFNGSTTAQFNVIKNLDSESLSFTAADKAFANRAGNFTTSFTLTDSDGRKLAAGADYVKTLVYTYEEDTELPGGIMRYAGDEAGASDIVPAGVTMRLTATLNGNYEGTVSDTFRITGQDISKASVRVGNQYYTGKEIRPDYSQIIVTVGKQVLTENDYEIVAYENNINKGTGKLTIKGVGEFGGTKVATFSIAARNTSYMITFYGNGATAGSMGNQQIAIGKSAKLAANRFSRTNYVFDGWADKAGNVYTNQQLIACTQQESGEVLNLYAQWVKKVVPDYTIEYFTNGGSNNDLNVTSYNVFSGDITIYAPEKENWPFGYQFGGWYKESNFRTRVSVIKAGSTGNVKLYAKWIPHSYTVKFDGNGADNMGVMADQGFSYGVSKKLTKNVFRKTVTEIVNNKKVTRSYVFLGWSTDAESSFAEYTDTQMVKDLVAAKNSSNDAVTLYAVWQDQFAINYDLCGGDALTGEEVTSYTYGTAKSIAKVSATRDGYDFAGWFREPTYRSRVTTIAKNSTGNITVYAKWTPWQYRIQYVGGEGATGRMSVQTVKTEGATMPGCSFKKAGMTFVGWMDEAGNVFYTGQVVNRDRLAAEVKNGTVFLTAVWEDSNAVKEKYANKANYTITFMANAPEGTKATGKTDAQKINFGQVKALNKNGFAVKGYSFTGWTDEQGNRYDNMAQIMDLDADFDGKVTLNANWEKQTYTVSYYNLMGDDNGGNIVSYTVDDASAAAITLNNPSAVGQTFAGWFTDAALRRKATNIPKGSTGDKVFYAKWTSNYYTISYNLNDNDQDKEHRAVLDASRAGYVNTYNSVSDKGYVLATAKREGYRFGGWYQDKACRKPVTFITGTPTVDMTVYAKWVKETENPVTHEYHSWVMADVAPTCTKDGVNGNVCRYCGAKQEGAVIPKLGHSYEIIEKVEATCAKSGKEIKKCTVCGQTTRVVIPATGNHTVSSRVVKAATYTEEGTEQLYCTVCDEVLSVTSIDMLEHEHVFKDVAIIREPTCTMPGRKDVVCTICGETFEKSIQISGHDYEWVENIPSTCTTNGGDKYKCSACGREYITSDAKKPHQYEWVTTTEATDDKVGLKEYKCKTCGDVKETETIPAISTVCTHPTPYRTMVVIVPATCVESAHLKVTCLSCGDVVYEDYQDPNGACDATNHAELMAEVIRPATIEETGLKIHYCNACGYQEEEELPKYDCHHWTKEVIYKDGKLYWQCKTCEALIGEATADDCVHWRNGYDYIERVTPDANTWGEVDKVCKNCKTVLDTTRIHPYSEYHITDENGEDVTLYGWFDYSQSREVFELTNEYRQENGLNTLVYNTTCQDASDLRALEAAVYWGHTRPNKTKWNTIIPQWQYGGENLAQGHKTPSQVMTGWKNSPGHNANLLYGQNSNETPFEGISVGCFHQYFFDNGNHYAPYEQITWSQNFTFYEY